MTNLKNGLVIALIIITGILAVVLFLKSRENEKLRNRVNQLEYRVEEISGTAEPREPVPADTVWMPPDTVTIKIDGDSTSIDSLPDIEFVFGGREPIGLGWMLERPILEIDTTIVDDNNIRTELNARIHRFTGDYYLRLRNIPPKPKKRFRISAVGGSAGELFLGLTIRYGDVFVGPIFTKDKISVLVGVDIY